jgi:hypothetical protein
VALAMLTKLPNLNEVCLGSLTGTSLLDYIPVTWCLIGGISSINMSLNKYRDNRRITIKTHDLYQDKKVALTDPVLQAK